jgi:glyoxylase-like metal-dependent hydrolase (beta-lactamase superfamily II)
MAPARPVCSPFSDAIAEETAGELRRIGWMTGRPLLVGICLLAAATGSGPHPPTEGLRSYFRAREVLNAGVEAIGGLDALRGASTFRRRMCGEWIGSGQHPRPHRVAAPTMTPPPANGHDCLTSHADYRGKRWLDERVESDFQGDSVARVTALSETSGFETLTYREEKPFYRAFSADDARAQRIRRFRRHPEGVLAMALERPETLAWVGEAEEFGRRQRVIAFADPLGTRVLLSFDATNHRLTKWETLREHATAGDTSAEVVFLDYRRVGKLTLPFHVVDRVAGVPTEDMRVSSIDLDLPLPQERFRPPDVFAAVEEDPAEPRVEALGDGLYLIRGPYNVVFAAFRDFVAVFEAPMSSRYAETCLELVRTTLPGKPIRFVVATHFHYDHVAGLRPHVAQGIRILTTPDARPVIEQVAASRRTMNPDALSHTPRSPEIETVGGKKWLDDGTNRAELHDFGPTDHVVQILMAYFPRQRVLFEADVWDPLSRDLDIAGSDAVRMAEKIRELGLTVERIVPVHGIPTTMEALERGLAVREKYRGPAS